MKATENAGANYYEWNATDLTKSLTGSWVGNEWGTSHNTNMRFHIDLGFSQVINRIYYENSHNSGATTGWGIKTFTLWGSNNAAAFADVTYGDDTNWTQITGLSQSTFDQHTGSDISDPKYITFPNTIAFRYYAIKISDNWGSAGDMQVRRIQLQCTQ